MSKTITNWTYQNKPFESANGNCGFVYLVVCNYPGDYRKYIGRKFFYSNFGIKSKQKESDWKYYKTSSRYVVEAIKKYGEEYFSFEILQVFKTRGGVVSGEVEIQWLMNVLHAKRDDGVPLFWNRHIGGVKFVTNELVSETTRQKLRDAWNDPIRKKTQSERAKLIAGRPESKQRLIKRNQSGVNLSIEDWQMVMVFELLKEGASHLTISRLTGIPKGTISGSLSRLSYKHQQDLHSEWVKFNEDQP